MTIQEITARHMRENKSNPTDMAARLSASVEVVRYSRTTPYLWMTGKRNPDPVLLRLLTLTPCGWLGDWALECLSLK